MIKNNVAHENAPNEHIMIFNKPTNEILLPDIEALISNEVAESRFLDYKKILSISSDEDKREFLSDVVSFANTAGGILLFGIEEQKGLPINITGIEGNSDELFLRIEEIIRTGIAPRLQGYFLHKVLLPANKYILVLQIDQSYAQPHMVTYKNLNRFLKRNHSGKSIMDVFEIRAAFAASGEITKSIRNFIHERRDVVSDSCKNRQLKYGPLISIHIVPTSAFLTNSKQITLMDRWQWPISPFAGGGYDQRFNLDGIYRFTRFSNEVISSSYMQMFKNGIVESATTNLIRFIQDGKLLFIDGKNSIEYLVTKFVLEVSSQMKAEGCLFPLYIFLSLYDVKGCRLASPTGLPMIYGANEIDRNDVHLPELIIPTSETDIKKSVQHLMNDLWNSFGFHESLTFYNNRDINAL